MATRRSCACSTPGIAKFYDAIGTDRAIHRGLEQRNVEEPVRSFASPLASCSSAPAFTSGPSGQLRIVVSAFAAFRAVQIGNMNVGLPNHVELKAHGGFHGGRPNLVLTLQRRF